MTFFPFFSTMSAGKSGTYRAGILGLLLLICSHCVIFETVMVFLGSVLQDFRLVLRTHLIFCAFQRLKQHEMQVFDSASEQMNVLCWEFLYYNKRKLLLIFFLSVSSEWIWLWHTSFKAGWSCFCYVCRIIRRHFWLNCGGSGELQVFCSVLVRSKDLSCR